MIRTKISHKSSTLLIGASVGIFLAWLLELVDRSPLVIFLLLATTVLTWLIVEFRNGVVFDPVGRFSSPLSLFVIFLLVLGMTAVTFGLAIAFSVNPTWYFYLPLLPLVTVSTALLGLYAGLFAIALSSIVSAYLFIPPIYSIWISDLEDMLGLAIFAVIGVFIAWGVQKMSLFR